MKRLLIICIAALGLAASLPSSLQKELQAISETYGSKLEYSLQLKMQVYDQQGNELQAHKVKTAREQEFYYADMVKMESYVGPNGAFMVNKGVKEVYYDPYTKSGNRLEQQIKQIENWLQDTSVEVKYSLKDEDRAIITTQAKREGLNPYRTELIYNRETKLIETYRLFSDNITESYDAPVKGHMVIHYSHKPLDRKVKSTYRILWNDLQNRKQRISSGDYTGFAIKL